ncbi:hypothetical protein ABPG72_011048 [Tetrahymena utriculariae]
MAEDRILQNKYQLIQRLDEGAVGQVYKAQNIITKEIVAVKQVSIKLFGKNEHLLNLFNQEIENLKKMKTLNTIKYIDNFYDDDYKYVVVEYVDGKTLKQKLQEEKEQIFSESTTTSYLIQLLKGIKDLHAHNIIHRDLKLENIMINKQGIIKIIDFGSSRQLKEGIKANTLVGTPYNMAPEVWNQKDYGRECDVYSLGVILYQMLFGDYPFFAKDINNLQKIIEEGKINFKRRNITISNDMKDLIEKMLKYKQNERISWQDIYNNIIIKNYLQNTMQTNQVEGKKLKQEQQEALKVYTTQPKIQEIPYLQNTMQTNQVEGIKLKQEQQEALKVQTAKPKKKVIPEAFAFSRDEIMYNQYYSQKQNYEIVIYTLQKMTTLPENVRNRCLIFILSKLAYTRASKLDEDLKNLYMQIDKIDELKIKVSKNLQEIKKIYELSITELQSEDPSSKLRSNSVFWKNIENEIVQFETLSNLFQQNFQNTLKNHKSLIKNHLYSLEQNNETQKKGYYRIYIISFLLSFKIFQQLDSKIEFIKIIEEIEQLDQNQLLSQFKSNLEKLIS